MHMGWVETLILTNTQHKFTLRGIIHSNNWFMFIAKHHPSQMRPRSRCLTVVHKEILNDVVFPSTISGRSMRVTQDGRKHQRVLLDPLDRDQMENKVDAIIHAYHRLTTHKIAIGFSKPSVFQQKMIASRAAKQWRVKLHPWGCSNISFTPLSLKSNNQNWNIHQYFFCNLGF